MNKTRAKDIENLDILAGLVVAVNENLREKRYNGSSEEYSVALNEKIELTLLLDYICDRLIRPEKTEIDAVNERKIEALKYRYGGDR